MSKPTVDTAAASASPSLHRPQILNTSLPNHGDGVKAIIDLAQKATDIELIELKLDGGFGKGLPSSIPLVVDPRGTTPPYGLKSVVEQHRTAPACRQGTAKVTTLQSLIDLANRHKSDQSALFAVTTWPQPGITAVIDYDDATSDPANHHHRIAYDFPITTEFKVWIENNGVAMNQGDFARFLEDHAPELASATDEEKAGAERQFKERMAIPTELVALSRDLEIHLGGKVKRQERLASGERVLEFTEEHSNASGGKVDIPGLFMVAMPAFLDGEDVRLLARLRYRLVGGDIKWMYHLYRWEDELRNRVKEDLRIAVEQTALPGFEGTPESLTK
jgi:uncharacterized protein YfdQ (DUF2303 family)